MPAMDEMMAEVVYEVWPPRATGGQMVGMGPQGVRGTHPWGFSAWSNTERSQFKNREIVKEMLEWALSRYVTTEK